MISHYSRSVNIVFKVAFWLVKIVSERINICSDVCLSLKFEQINKTEKKKRKKRKHPKSFTHSSNFYEDIKLRQNNLWIVGFCGEAKSRPKRPFMYRRIFVYTFCLINICLSLSDDANKIKTLNIERE